MPPKLRRQLLSGPCIKSLREGDTLIVWRLDRLGRNLADLVSLIAEFERRRINFESLTEKMETVSPAGRLIFHVFAALAEFERNLIRERTKAELTAARARGRTGGCPSKLTPKEIKTIRALLKSAEIPVAEIAAPSTLRDLPFTGPSSSLPLNPNPFLQTPKVRSIHDESQAFLKLLST